MRHLSIPGAGYERKCHTPQLLTYVPLYKILPVSADMFQILILAGLLAAVLGTLGLPLQNITKSVLLSDPFQLYKMLFLFSSAFLSMHLAY